MTVDTFQRTIERQLNLVYPPGSSRLGELEDCTTDQADAVLDLLLRYGCQSQHMGNIGASRNLLLEIPSTFLRAKLPNAIEASLDLDDEWQYRRLLEILRVATPSLLRRYVESGKASGVEDIQDAANDFKWIEQSGMELRYLFQVSDVAHCPLGVELLPGIPQSLIRNRDVGDHFRQGAQLQIHHPDGSVATVTMTTFQLSVPSSLTEYEVAKKLPLRPVVGSDTDLDQIPVGSEVYLEIAPRTTA